MSIIEQLLAPLTLDEFTERYFHKEPYAAPFRAASMRNLISWYLLSEIFANDHDDCWLPAKGQLPIQKNLNSGFLTINQALQGFQEGRTVLIRHSERAHPTLGAIARDFYNVFRDPVDIQLYCTPAGQEGFDWHYDVEDVFVIQSSGEKEFRLKKNSVSTFPLDPKTPQRELFFKEKPSFETRCWLKPGDWLYIPAGYWHKAKALEDSCHLSVGVMSSRHEPKETASRS